MVRVTHRPPSTRASSAYRRDGGEHHARRGARSSRDGRELLTLNIGPHHPATHGVLRLLATLEGEIVRDVKPIIGYVHTGIEKTAEDKSYWKVIPVVERMDYLSYYFNATAFCGAVETLLEVEVPKRAQYLRVIHLELNRIMSHLVWLGTSALDLGAISMLVVLLPRPRAAARPVRDVVRPAHAHALLPGRRRHRGHPAPAGSRRSRRFTSVMPERADSYGDLLEQERDLPAAPARRLPAARGAAARRSA